jgi:hypothetical protein
MLGSKGELMREETGDERYTDHDDDPQLIAEQMGLF